MSIGRTPAEGHAQRHRGCSEWESESEWEWEVVACKRAQHGNLDDRDGLRVRMVAPPARSPSFTIVTWLAGRTDRLASAWADSRWISGSGDCVSGTSSCRPPSSTMCAWRSGFTASLARRSATSRWSSGSLPSAYTMSRCRCRRRASVNSASELSGASAAWLAAEVEPAALDELTPIALVHRTPAWRWRRALATAWRFDGLVHRWSASRRNRQTNYGCG